MKKVNQIAKTEHPYWQTSIDKQQHLHFRLEKFVPCFTFVQECKVNFWQRNEKLLLILRDTVNMEEGERGREREIVREID